MPRRRSAPRLYLDKTRDQWVIRDGARFVRTGCARAALAEAEKQLAAYIGGKHKPERGPDPLIADVLLVYDKEHLQHTATADQGRYRIGFLGKFFGANTVSEITSVRCREYANSRASRSGARKDLEILRAAIRFWHRQWGPLPTLPTITLPAKEEPRTRWLSRSEAARLLHAARRTEHLKRFILLGLYTGSRSKNILGLRWEQIDLRNGVMARRGAGVSEQKTKRSPPVRLGRRILSHLRRWRLSDQLEPSGYVIHFEGRPVARVNKANGSFRRAAHAAGLKEVTPHTLRHTRATWLMQAGISHFEAAGHLGMSPEVLFKVYGHHHPDFQKDAAEV